MLGRKYNIIGFPGNRETAGQTGAGIITSLGQHIQDSYEGTNNSMFPSVVAASFSSTTPGALGVYEKYKNFPIPGYIKMHGKNTANPLTDDTSVVSCIRYSPTGQYIAIGTVSSLYFQKVNKLTGGQMTYLTPATQPGIGKYISWTPNDEHVVTCGATTAIDNIWVFKRSGDTFTQLTIPATGFQIYSCEFSPDGTYLAIGAGSSNLRIFKRSGDTFTLLATPTAPGGITRVIKWAEDSSFFVIYYSAAPYLYIYTRSGDTFTRSALAPDVAITGAAGTTFWAHTFSMSKVGNDYYFFIVPNTSTTILVYKYVVGTSITLQTGLGAGTLPNGSSGYGGVATRDGKYYFAATNGTQLSTSPFSVYRNDNGTLTLISDTWAVLGNPAASSAYTGNCVDISPY